MHSNIHQKWLAKYSNLQEEFGQKPDSPLTAIQVHISDEIQNQNEIIKYASENMSHDIVDGIRMSTAAISGTLEKGFNTLVETNERGFNKLSSDLNTIDSTLNQISGILSWGFSEIIEQIKTSNILLGNIATLLKIPDFQKESEAYIKEGMKYFRNAMFNKKRYNDALENFLLAEKKANTNYYLLQKIGLIYLFSKEHLNIELALEYFLKAADYSFDETIENSAKTINYLNNNVYVDFKNQHIQILDIKSQTAYSYIYAGRCYYILEDYNKALEYVTKAYNLMPSILEGGYDKAKYLIKLNKVNEAINVLDLIIEKDKFITLKIINDFDFISKPKIILFLKKIHKEKKEEYNKFINTYTQKTSNDFLNNQFKKFKEQAKGDDFISMHIVLEKLENEFEYTIQNLDTNKIKKELVVDTKIINTTPKKCYSHLIKTDKKFILLQEYIFLKQFIKQSIINKKELTEDIYNLKKGLSKPWGIVFTILTISLIIYLTKMIPEGLILFLSAIVIIPVFVSFFTNPNQKKIKLKRDKLIELDKQLDSKKNDLNKLKNIIKINDFDDINFNDFIECNTSTINSLEVIEQQGLEITPQIGHCYKGIVKNIFDFGAFIEFLPKMEGLLHISEIAHTRTNNVKDVFEIGQEVIVKLIEDNPSTKKKKLSMKALFPKPKENINELIINAL